MSKNVLGLQRLQATAPSLMKPSDWSLIACHDRSSRSIAACG
jgi:hypothetical protein